MPCIYLTEEDALNTLQELKARGIENILALRGDETPGRERTHRFEHASDLIAFIKEKAPEFNIIGACYPEGHAEAKTVAADIRNLKTKVDAGASELISQMFLTMPYFTASWNAVKSPASRFPSKPASCPSPISAKSKT